MIDASSVDRRDSDGPSARLVGVFTGQPAVIGETRGRPVTSSIAKSPVTVPHLQLGRTNLEGDRQADLTVHGGPDKAVYAYASGHYPKWQDDGFVVDVGALGENVTLAGVTERDVRIGDIWRWGDALVEVSQPRAPCYKLSVHTGRKDIGPHMIATRWCGWYLRVLEPGTVPTSGSMVLTERPDGAATVDEAFAAMFAETAPGSLVARVLSSSALADQWRKALVSRRGEGRGD